MLTLTGAGLATLNGFASGLHSTLLVAAPASALAAGLSGYRRAPRSRVWWSVAIVALGWAVGEGITIGQWVLGNPDMFAAAPEAWFHLVAWIAAGLGIGYALPAVGGAYVGRLVHKGTGYLSAGVVALMIAPAVSQIGLALTGLLSR